MNELEKNIEKSEEWFDNNIAIYKSLAENVANTLKTALDKQGIMYIDIPCRAKEKKSFLKKFSREKYSDIGEIMDLAGIRIITLVEDDLDAVEDLIRELFNVHDNDSIDKSKDLGHEKFGYRSRHFICDIGKIRENLKELQHFKGLKFEIQIRTALAHAWAEIEHDRGYKLEGGLPENIKRRLNIVAAMLEAADNEFNRLTKDISKYAEKMKSKIASNELDMELTSIGIQELLLAKYSEYLHEENFNLQHNNIFKDIVFELSYFGVNDMLSFSNLMDEVFVKHQSTLKKITKLEKRMSNDVGLIRNVLILKDIELYFSIPFSWDGDISHLYDALKDVYDTNLLDKLNTKRYDF